MRKAAIALGLALLGACGGGGGGGGGGLAGGSRLAGRLLLSDAGGAVLEAEPNDTADQAHVLGTLRAGDTITVLGRTTALDASDPFDGFQLTAPERVSVTATLAFDASPGNDFDMGVYEFAGMQYVQTFLATTAPEVGTFVAKGTFNLVVTAYAGAGDYTLTISAAALPSGVVAEREPNTSCSGLQWVGEVLPGDSVVMTGSASASSDAQDGFLVSCPVGVGLSFSLAFGGIADLDLEVCDGTADRCAPTGCTAFASGSANPETGLVEYAGTHLVVVRVKAFSGSSSWTLTVNGLVPGASVLKASAFAPPTRLGPASAEALALKRPPPRPYGTPARDLVAGEVIVAPVAGLEEDADAHLAVQSASFRRRPPRGARLVGLAAAGEPTREDALRRTLAAARCLARDPSVAYAETNGRKRKAAQPDDPSYNLQWHYQTIHLPEAWDTTTGSASVTVAVIDTGIRLHPDLAGRLLPGYDFVSDPASALDGNGYDPDPTDPGDEGGGRGSWHGTHVAGTVGAAGNNASGVTGVAWDVRIMPLRALGLDGGTDYDLAQAILYAARLPNASGALPSARAHVINMSLGGPGTNQTLANAVAAARAAGVVIVAAAGNESTSTPSYPAAYDGVIAVSAVDWARAAAWYTNFGTWVDVAAPGGDVTVDQNGDGRPDGVLSTYVDDSVTPNRWTYDYLMGTSMASPHVAGVVALMLSVNPSLTPSQVEALLATNSEDLGAPGRDAYYGDGLVDAARAVRAAQGANGTDPIMALSASSVDFGTGRTQVDVAITNVGGGLLSVGTPQAIVTDGPSWLAAAATGSADASRSASTLRITVDRDLLPTGAQFGRVVLPSNGGTREVQVLATGGSNGPVPDLLVWVLAVHPATRETVAQTLVRTTQTVQWEIQGLAPGSYLVVAGTDDDDDGFVGEDGEWAGAWPTHGEPEEVAVGPGETLSGLDFALAPSSSIPAGARLPARRLHR